MNIVQSNQSPLLTLIEEFNQCKRLALVGASRNGKKFGNIAYNELKARGYDVLLVHNEARGISGVQCYPSLNDLQGKVDRLLIIVPPKQAYKIIQEASDAGIKYIWLQRGAESSEVLSLAHDLKLKTVFGSCILMHAPPVRSFHRIHRAFARLFRRL